MTRLEDVIRRRRDSLRDRLAAGLRQQLSEDECYALAAALERNIADGESAAYTPAERAALEAFDALLASRPDMADIVRELNRDSYVN